MKINEWYSLLQNVNVECVSHKYICRQYDGDREKIKIFSQLEIDNSADTIKKLTLSEIVDISNKIYDKKSVSLYSSTQNNFLLIFSAPFQGFKKYPRFYLVKKVNEIISNTNFNQLSELIIASEINNKLVPLGKKTEKLKTIFEIVEKMTKKSHEKAAKESSLFKRVVHWMYSKFCGTSWERIKAKCETIDNSSMATTIAVNILHGKIIKRIHTINYFQGVKPMDIDEFVDRFISNKESLKDWCRHNDLGSLSGTMKIIAELQYKSIPFPTAHIIKYDNIIRQLEKPGVAGTAINIMRNLFS